MCSTAFFEHLTSANSFHPPGNPRGRYCVILILQKRKWGIERLNSLLFHLVRGWAGTSAQEVWLRPKLLKEIQTNELFEEYVLKRTSLCCVQNRVMSFSSSPSKKSHMFHPQSKQLEVNIWSNSYLNPQSPQNFSILPSRRNTLHWSFASIVIKPNSFKH